MLTRRAFALSPWMILPTASTHQMSCHSPLRRSMFASFASFWNWPYFQPSCFTNFSFYYLRDNLCWALDVFKIKFSDSKFLKKNNLKIVGFISCVCSLVFIILNQIIINPLFKISWYCPMSFFFLLFLNFRSQFSFSDTYNPVLFNLIYQRKFIYKFFFVNFVFSILLSNTFGLVSIYRSRLVGPAWVRPAFGTFLDRY